MNKCDSLLTKMVNGATSSATKPNVLSNVRYSCSSLLVSITLTKSEQIHNRVPILDMSTRYWNSQKRKAPLRWDDSVEDLIEQEFAEYCHAEAEAEAEEDHFVGEFHEGSMYAVGVVKPEVKASTSGAMRATVAEDMCPICCESRPIFVINKKCHHAAACLACLRRLYVVGAQQDVARYPLKCFAPQCHCYIRGAQLEKVGLFRNDEEKARHYRLAELAKRNQMGKQLRLIHCPHCDHPCTCKRTVVPKKRFRCRSCKQAYKFSPELQVHQAVSSLNPDKYGINDGYGYCPNCGILISKGNGCSSMSCICGKHFNWEQVRGQPAYPVQLGVVPEDEIALWYK